MESTSNQIRIAIVDSHEVIRLGVKAALRGDPRILIVGEGATQAEAVQLSCEHRPHVVLLGLNNGFSQSRPKEIMHLQSTVSTLAQKSNIHVLVLSRYGHVALARMVLRAGAAGFMLKDEAMYSSEILTQAIRAIAKHGSLPLSQALYKKLHPYGLDAADAPSLTRRRVEIMQAIVDHPRLTLVQVADMLGIAESTLRNNLSAVSQALDTPSLKSTVIECLRLGLVQLYP